MQNIDGNNLHESNDCRSNPNFSIKEQVPKNKKDLLSHPGVCMMADMHKLSHRSLTEFIGEMHKAKNEDMDKTKLSVMTSKRRRDSTRTTKGTQFLNTNLEKITGHGILHWDGKIFKKLTHIGDSKERVAYIDRSKWIRCVIRDPTV